MNAATKATITLSMLLWALPALSASPESTNLEKLKIFCADKNTERAPYLSFNIEITSAKGTTLLSPGSFAEDGRRFSVTALTQSSYTTGRAFEKKLKTCQSQASATRATINEDELVIWCDGDGENGEITLNLMAGVGLAYGEFIFPEESSEFSVLGVEKPEDFLKIEMICKFDQ